MFSCRSFSISSDGIFAEAAADAPLGPSPDGKIVIRIDNCPPNAGLADMAQMARFIVPSHDGYSVDYSRLVARSSGTCCGGACG